MMYYGFTFIDIRFGTGHGWSMFGRNRNKSEVVMATVIDGSVARDDDRKVTVDGTEYPVSIEIDYTDCPREVLLKKAFGSDVVRHQNGTLRQMDTEQLENVTSKPIRIHWTQVGKRPMSKAQAAATARASIAALRATGMNDDQIAEIIGK